MLYCCDGSSAGTLHWMGGSALACVTEASLCRLASHAGGGDGEQ